MSIKIYGVQSQMININLKLSAVLNIQMVLNYHHIYGSFKGFVDNLLHKFVSYWMLVRNQDQKEYLDFYKHFKIKILVGLLDS